jgi:hypothetical protein
MIKVKNNIKKPILKKTKYKFEKNQMDHYQKRTKEKIYYKIMKMF